MSRYGVFSGPYFPVFIPNIGKYGPEKAPYLKDEDPITVDTVKDKYLFGIDCGTLFME